MANKHFSKEQVEEIEFALKASKGDRKTLLLYIEHFSDQWGRTLPSITSKFWAVKTDN